VYWCCAQIEQCHDRLAWHCLTLAGYKVYQPLLREQRRSHGRKIIATPPLFPGYLFVWVVKGWWDARPRGFVPGMRVKVVSGPLQNQIGMLAILRPHERVLVLLRLLGGEQRVELARTAIEPIE